MGFGSKMKGIMETGSIIIGMATIMTIITIIMEIAMVVEGIITVAMEEEVTAEGDTNNSTLGLYIYLPEPKCVNYYRRRA